MQLQAATASAAAGLTMIMIALFMTGMYLAARRDTSTGYWAIAAVLMAVGAVSPVPLFRTAFVNVGTWLAVTLVIAGGVCWWWGMRVFFGRSAHVLGWWIIAVNSLACALIIAVTDATWPRIYNFGAGALAIVLLVVHETWRGDGAPLTIGRRMVVLSYLAAMGSLLIRAFYFLSHGIPVRPMTDHSVNALLLYTMPSTCVLLSAVGALLMYFERTIAQKDYLATHDDLTRLCNRRALSQQGAQALSDARETGRPLAMLLIDIDHFKALNDTCGHDAGDRALRAVADTLSGSCRPFDVVGRQGGEEFCIMCPDTTAQEALRLGERLLREIGALEPPPGLARRFSISIGVAAAGESESWDTLLRQADRALYAAKAAGRNRAVAD
ncbi:MAG: diguanylate cyclase [Sphingomonadales bacterium]